MPISVIYPGTFDPITNGHTDLVARATRVFGRVVVAVAESAAKEPFLPLDRRVELAQVATAGLAGVEVCVLHGLLVDFVRTRAPAAILRGLRAVSDFEHEFQLAGMNRRMAPEIETLFLTPAEHYSYISSSLVRELARLGGNVEEFVHPQVAAELGARLG